jgi:hypothetical protein
LKYLKNGKYGFENNCYINQIERENNMIFDFNTVQEPIFIDFPEKIKVVDESEILRKQEIRLKQAERLREAMQKKREEKKKNHEKELQDLEQLELKYKEDPQSAKAILLNKHIQIY